MTVSVLSIRPGWKWVAGLLAAMLIVSSLVSAARTPHLGTAAAPAYAQSGHSVPPDRLAKLTRGVNLSHWFWEPFTPDPLTSFQSYVDAEDLWLLNRMGFRHIRLPVDTIFLVDWNRPGELNPATLQYVDAAIQMALVQDLAVIVAPFGEYNMRAVDPGQQDVMRMFWDAFAAFLGRYDPDQVFIQLGNEPVAEPATLTAYQNALVETIRAHAPEHTIITATTQRVDGRWDRMLALDRTPPLDDTNVVYSLHFYDPIEFTHYGADWIAGNWTNSWDPNFLSERLTVAANWAARHGVPIIVDEFGVYKSGGVSQAGRIEWLRFVRTFFERHSFGWTLWDYSAGFGFVDADGPNRTLDLAVLTALGLSE